MYLAIILSLCFLFPSISRAHCCPHEDPALTKFSEHYTNYDKQTDLVVTDDILLDVTLLDVNTVGVEGNGKLVFNQGHDITVKVNGIYVRDNGSLIIGSELCRHADNVNIVLQGTRTVDRSTLTGAGEKYIVVRDAGTLQIYGEDKLAWTKLTQTIPEAAYATNHVYWHKESDVSNFKQWHEGLTLYVFNATQKKFFYAYDFNRDTSADEMIQVNMMLEDFEVISEGDLVAISVQNFFTHKDETNMTDLFDTIEQMAGMPQGSLLLRNSNMYDAFSLLFVKGGSFSQDHEPSLPNQYPGRALASIDYQGHKVTAESLIYYRKSYKSFIDLRILSPEVGYPEIHVVDDITSWSVGDKLLITSTDYEWRHSEVRTIHEITGTNTLKLSAELIYRHFGEIENGVDMRAEVALLSRNVKIEGEIARECPQNNGNCDRLPYDTYGGHIKIIENFTKVVIDGAELENMGQATDMGFYPVHFHMCLDITNRTALLRRNSIHNTYARAVTVHGTYGTSPSLPGVEVVENVAFRIHGSAYFLEDGIERATLFVRNLVADVLNVDGDFIADKTQASGYWITTPQAVFIGNVAAGGPGFGFWYLFPDEPVGLSQGLVYQRNEAWRTPLWSCDNNVAHSHTKGGLFFDGKLADNVGNVEWGARYFPVNDPLDKNSGTVKVQIVRFTAYKNARINTWIRGGEVEMMQYSSAESRKGLQLARSTAQSQWMKKSVFIGRSSGNSEDENYPDAVDHKFVLGVVFYDGPVYFENSWFTNFDHGPNKTYVSAAIGFNPQNKFNSAPVSSVKDVRFGFSDDDGGNRVFDGTAEDEEFGFGNKNGDESATFRDMDGSVTKCPGNTNWTGPQTVLKPEKFLLTEKCEYRENWQMAVCNELYGKVSFNARKVFAEGFNVSNQLRRVRYANTSDTAYEDHDGGVGSSTEYMVILGDDGYYYEHQYITDFPKEIEVRGKGIERDSPVVFGLCLPENTTREDLKLFAMTPDDIYWGDDAFIAVDSIQELSADTYMNRYLLDGRMFYMKMQSRKVRESDWDKFDTDHCPGRFCPVVVVTLKAQRPYTPCFSPTQEELSTDVYVPDSLRRSDCSYPASAQPDTDWGAGDTMTGSRDGNWGEWSGWAECCNANGFLSKTSRHRLCDNPPKYGDGADCQGLSREVESCQVDCPVDGQLTEWSMWSDCTCSGSAAGSRGLRVKTRECIGTANGGNYCEGYMKYYSSCSGDCGSV